MSVEKYPSVPEPGPEYQESPDKKKVVIVEASEAVEEKARDVAEARLTASLEEQKGIHGLAKRIWKHNLFFEYYRQQEIQKAKKEILEKENLYADEERDKFTHEATMKTIVEQFSSEYDEVIHKEAGEKREYLGDTKEETDVKSRVKKLIRDFAQQDLNKEEVIKSFVEGKNRIFSEVKGVKNEIIDKGVLYADNLLEITKEIQRNIEHGKKLEELDLDFDVVVGKAKSGVRTEAQFNAVDKIIDKIQKTRVGRFANEATVAIAVSLAYSLSAGLSQRLASSRLFAWGSFGATAALGASIGGLREKKRLEEERKQHGREMAMNKKFSPEKSPRRKEMEEFRYETKEATALADALEQSLYRTKEDGAREVRNLTQEELQVVLANLTEIESRIKLSDRERVDLISFSDSTKVERERLRLDILRAQAKVDLRKLTSGEIKKITSGTEFDYKLENLIDLEQIKSFLDSPEYKNETDEIKRKNLLAYWIHERRDEKGFRIEDIEKVHGSFTPEAARGHARWDWIRAEEILDAWKSSGKKEEIILGKDLKIPEGKTLEEYLSSLTGARLEQLIKGDEGMEKRNALFKAMRNKRVAKAVVKGLVIGLGIGGAAQEAAAFFREGQEGFIEGLVRGHKGAAKGIVHFTPLEYLRCYFTGDLPRADMSNLHEIVIDNTRVKLPEGIDALKNPDGSFNLIRGKDTISEYITFDNKGHLTEEAKKMLAEKGITATSATEHLTGTKTAQVSTKDYIEQHKDWLTEIKRRLWYDNDTPKPIFDKNELRLDWGGIKGTGIDEHGNYVYSVKRMLPDGSYHKEFSANALELTKEGKLKLLLSLSRDSQSHVFEVPIDGNYNAVIDPNSEAGKLLFANVDGKAKLMAQFAEVAEMTSTKDGVEQVRILATDVGQGIESIVDKVPEIKDIPTTIFEPPADYRIDPPPFIPIFGRRPLEPTGVLEPIPYYSYGYKPDAERRKNYEASRSKTLLENPGASLEHFSEIGDYFKKQSKGHLKDVKEAVMKMNVMDSDCRLAICIPVAGHQEGENIYRTLENYLNQTADKKTFEITLFVNRPEKDKEGKPVKPDKTLLEVRRFQKNYPDINIQVIEKVLPPEKSDIGYIRKFLNDVVLYRHHERGKKAPDLIMVSNDADSKGVAPEYINNFIDKFDKNSQVDALAGQLDWDTKSYVNNPLIHVGTRLFQYIEAQSRAKGWHIASSGANFAFKSSIYAGVGGYTENIGGGEDTDLGEKIKLSRSGATKYMPIAFAGAHVSRLYTSSRRAEKSIREGLAPIEQWDKGFSAFEDEVRKIKWEKMGKRINFKDKSQTEKLTKELQNVINRTILRTKSWGGTSRDKVLTRALGWLGLKYKITGDYAIEITNASRLLKGLEEYQKQGLEIKKRKTGRFQPKTK